MHGDFAESLIEGAHLRKTSEVGSVDRVDMLFIGTASGEGRTAAGGGGKLDGASNSDGGGARRHFNRSVAGPCPRIEGLAEYSGRALPV
jgi:hypothetical protein